MAHEINVSSGRIGWIDWARALGACAIVLLHVLVSTALAIDVGRAREVAYAVAGIVACRWAVPSFFMLSGFLLLDPARTANWKSALRHAKRMAVVLATFGLAFALMEEVWSCRAAGEPITPWVLPRAVVDVLTLHTWDHLWYVYAQLGVYLLMPAIRAVKNRLGERGFALATAGLVVGVLAVPTFLQVTAPNLLIGITCFCVGGCLRHQRLDWRAMAVGLGSLAVMLAVSLWGVLRGLGDQGFIFLQGSCFASGYAVLVLLFLRRRCGDGAMPLASPVARLSHESFGIYLIHPFFIHLALLALDPAALAPGVYELGLFAAVLAASYACSCVLRHVPVIRDVL